MAFSVPDLPYDFGALEPHIDARTMEIHHDRHHALYVANLNNAVAGTPLADMDINGLVSDSDAVSNPAVRNNGGGHANHSLFWTIMSADGGGEPSGALADAINAAFGGFGGFQEKLNAAAMTRFGSGWAWLSVDGGNLVVGVDAEPRLAPDGRPHADSGRRRLGARVLPQLSEPPP